MKESVPYAVVGAGVVGLLVAWYLASSGKRVVVLDRQVVGRESSWAGGGILSPVYPSRYASVRALVQRSAEEYPRIIQEIQGAAGVDPEFTLSGLIVLDPEPGDEGSYNDNYRGELLSADSLKEIEPQLAPFAPSALYYQKVGQVRNPLLIAALRSALSTIGVKFYEHRTVTSFITKSGCICGMNTTSGPIEGEKFVVAAGAWTGELLQPTALQLPIKPVRGQMIVIKAPPGLIKHIIVYRYHYLIPRRDGRILVGSTVENAHFNKEITLEARDTLWGAAVEMAPRLAEYPIEHQWAGLRPGTPDGIPFIGQHPKISGLFICAGHHRNGFATGPASAELVTDLMLGRQPKVDPSPYRIDRPTVPWAD